MKVIAYVHPVNAFLCKLGLHFYALPGKQKVGRTSVSFHYDCVHCPKRKVVTGDRVDYEQPASPTQPCVVRSRRLHPRHA